MPESSIAWSQNKAVQHYTLRFKIYSLRLQIHTCSQMIASLCLCERVVTLNVSIIDKYFKIFEIVEANDIYIFKIPNFIYPGCQ